VTDTARQEDAERPFRRARLIDVAEAAGTSKPIASRILNGDPTLSVGNELRERVFAAAEQLKYRPNAAARGLRRSATGAIGMLVPELTNTVFALIVRGAFKAAAERDYVVLLAEDYDEQQAGESFARLVAAGRIDGLVVASARPGHPLLAELETYRTPHVFVNRGVTGSGRNIVVDDAAATRMALDHLFELGHRRMAHIAGPLDLDPARRRAEAFREHAAVLGLESATVVQANLLESGGREAMAALLGESHHATAIYASSVTQAAGALSAAWHSGLHVPEDVSVIAYADTPLAAALIPPLSAIAMPMERLGKVGVEALLDQFNGRERGDTTVADRPLLVLRGSCAPPSGSPA